jgi:hypothetical protein
MAGLLAAVLWSAGCQRAWTEEERRGFIDDCLSHARLDDEALRTRLCNCWLERAASAHSHQEIKSSDPQVGQSIVQMGKQCAQDIGIRAYLPGEK